MDVEGRGGSKSRRHLKETIGLIVFVFRCLLSISWEVSLDEGLSVCLCVCLCVCVVGDTRTFEAIRDLQNCHTTPNFGYVIGRDNGFPLNMCLSPWLSPFECTWAKFLNQLCALSPFNINILS